MTIAKKDTITLGVALTRCLEVMGVRHIFGIPGNHTLELYRGLDQAALTHITTRHEQGAAFMADGYARAAGTPGVCYLISGPGLLNAATALGQALADSVPILVVTAVAERQSLGRRLGQLHELPDQQAAARSFCRASFRLEEPEQLVETLTTAWQIFYCERPGPVHIEIPLDVMKLPVSSSLPTSLTLPALQPGLTETQRTLIESFAERLARASAPALLFGGGCQRVSPAAATQLAERLNAPLATTVNGKGLLPPEHPLALGSSPSAPTVAALLTSADVVLAVGTEFGETDYDLLMTKPFELKGELLRIDIEREQLQRNVTPSLALAAPAEAAVPALIKALAGRAVAATGGEQRVRDARARYATETHHHPDFARFFNLLNEVLPDAIVVGDSTRPTYYATWLFERPAPRRYFHSVSGFGTLGYAIPAAFGARAATEQPVLALIGDGGAQFTLPELATAVDAKLPVTVIIWCNRGYEEIENSLAASGVSNRSTAISGPDFKHIAAAYGLTTYAATDWDSLREALLTATTDAKRRQQPNLLLLEQAALITEPSGHWY